MKEKIFITHKENDNNDNIYCLKIKDKEIISKQKAIDLINIQGQILYTWVNDKEGSLIKVVDNKYLRTDSNNNKKDNLDELPNIKELPLGNEMILSHIIHKK